MIFQYRLIIVQNSWVGPEQKAKKIIWYVKQLRLFRLTRSSYNTPSLFPVFSNDRRPDAIYVNKKAKTNTVNDQLIYVGYFNVNLWM